MTLSIWRYSHLLLALSAGAFILIASVTGTILAFEPISNKLQPFGVKGAKHQSIAQTLSVLENTYDEVIRLDIDEHYFVKASVIENNGESGTFYIDPFTGQKLGEPTKKAPLFEFATNLHRSLFLKSTGRFIIGFVSLLLCIIAITGVFLVAKRQGGFRRWFSKVVNENFEQDYHVKLGRYTLLPIIIITLSGVFLSLERFSVLPEHKLEHKTQDIITSARKPLTEFPIFKNSTLSDLVSIEFPFSNEEDDYYILKLTNKELHIHQYTGQVLSQAQIPLTASLLDWSIILHTGRGTIIWSIVLGLACIAVLFFMYSGFVIFYRRRKGAERFQNVNSANDSEYIVLVGSETGNTFSFAKCFAEALIKAKQTVFVDSLNNYRSYPKAKQLLVLTATYGEGDAPSNAKKFEEKLKNVHQESLLNYAVVGFGSLLYPDYCRYAIVVDGLLQKHIRFNPKMPLFKINNQSFEAFTTWVNQWCSTNQLNLVLQQPNSKKQTKALKPFTIVNKTPVNDDQTFLIQLKPSKKIKFTSGDLLAIYPKPNEIERLYSIGKVDDTITLSVKCHPLGLASNFLSSLQRNDMINAKIKSNPDFHFPNYANAVIMIANGTGIAPFLGMLDQNKKRIDTHLFWGGRTHESLQLYSKFIDRAFSKKQLTSFHATYSQEQQEKIYVQDIINEHLDLFCKVLINDGVIMICGAIAMQNQVLDVLDQMVRQQFGKPLSDFENNGQLKMDCY